MPSQPLFEKLQTPPRAIRVAIVSLIVGIIACYGALIPVNIFGAWRGNWLHWAENGPIIVVLASICFASTMMKLYWLPFAVVILIAIFAFIPAGMDSPFGFWRETWMVWTHMAFALAIVAEGVHQIRKNEFRGWVASP